MPKPAGSIRESSARRIRPVQIFLADASLDVQSQVSEWSRQHPFVVRTFSNGRQFLRRVENEQPDLILCDLALPSIDGLTALRLLKNHPSPVVMLTVDSPAGAHGALEALIGGAADYLLKREVHGRERIAISPAEVGRRLAEWQPAQYARGDYGADHWFEWNDDGRAQFVARPFPATQSWTGLTLAATRSIRPLVCAFTACPRQMAGAMMIRVHQPDNFAHALRGALMRYCDRAVVDLMDGEELRPGQWRFVSSSRLLAGHDDRRPAAWRTIAQRGSDPRNSLRRQIQQLESGAVAPLRLYLFERPDALSIPPLSRLAARGHAVLLHETARRTAPLSPERVVAPDYEPSSTAGRPR